MSFDALTIAGMLSAGLAGSLLIALAITNAPFRRMRRRATRAPGCR